MKEIFARLFKGGEQQETAPAEPALVHIRRVSGEATRGLFLALGATLGPEAVEVGPPPESYNVEGVTTASLGLPHRAEAASQHSGSAAVAVAVDEQIAAMPDEKASERDGSESEYVHVLAFPPKGAALAIRSALEILDRAA